MPRAATIAQADLSRVIRAAKECGYDCVIEIEAGKIRVVPLDRPKASRLDTRKEFRL